MQQREIEIVNKLGLHARASAKLTQLAAKYQCDVSAGAQRTQDQCQEHHGRDDAGGGQGRQVVLETDGPDETEAMDAIVALIGDYFGEGQ